MNSLPMNKEVLIAFEVEDRACAVSLSPALVHLARLRNGAAGVKSTIVLYECYYAYPVVYEV